MLYESIRKANDVIVQLTHKTAVVKKRTDSFHNQFPPRRLHAFVQFCHSCYNYNMLNAVQFPTPPSDSQK